MKKLLIFILPFLSAIADGQVSRIMFSSGGGSSDNFSSSFGETFVNNSSVFSLGSRKGDSTYTVSGINRVGKPADKIILFPNPTQNEFTVMVKGTDENNFGIKAYDMQGNELLSSIKNSGQTNISLSGYASGTYILSVLAPDGKLLFNQKIVKQ